MRLKLLVTSFLKRFLELFTERHTYSNKFVLMTACTMPSDYGAELMLGSSPVMGAGFHGTGSTFFADYPRCGSPGLWGDSNNTSNAAYYPGNLMCYRNPSDYDPSEQCRTFARTGSLRRNKKLEKLKKEFAPQLLTIPAKSILRQQEEFPQEDDALTSPTREKKRVCFADALGQQLAEIKLITERPDCPPLWSSEFIEKVTGGFSTEPPVNQWEITFAQPASDYVNFKLRLDRENVALENVLIDEKNGIIKGTVKVRNLSFHKDVSVRYTSNGWITTDDCTALYIAAPCTTVAYDLYDRFAFEVPLPNAATTDKLEFCVRFTCDGTEYWDNNNGRNFILISFRSKNKESSQPVKDAYQLKLDSWTEFASWNNLTLDDSPYW